MKIRTTLQSAIAVPLIYLMCLFPVTVSQTGCNKTQLETAVNTILTEATNVLAVAEPGAPWIPQLQSAIASLKQAESTWQGGGAVAVVDDALNTIEAVTAVIPLTASYSALIDVLVAAIEAALSLIPQPVTGAVTMRAMRVNPHLGRAAQPKTAKDSIAQWNTVVGANSQLAAARI